MPQMQGGDTDSHYLRTRLCLSMLLIQALGKHEGSCQGTSNQLLRATSSKLEHFPSKPSTSLEEEAVPSTQDSLSTGNLGDSSSQRQGHRHVPLKPNQSCSTGPDSITQPHTTVCVCTTPQHGGQTPAKNIGRVSHYWPPARADHLVTATTMFVT